MASRSSGLGEMKRFKRNRIGITTRCHYKPLCECAWAALVVYDVRVRRTFFRRWEIVLDLKVGVVMDTSDYFLYIVLWLKWPFPGLLIGRRTRLEKNIMQKQILRCYLSNVTNNREEPLEGLERN